MNQDNPLILLESVLETFTVLNADGTVRYQSPWVGRMLGYTQGELSGRSVFDFIHPEDRPTILAAFADVIRNPGSTVSAEFRFQHRDGSWQFLQAAGKSLRDETGTVSIVISARNVTERKEAEAKLLRLSNAIQMSTDSIVLTDLQGQITEVNPATLRIYGTARKEDLIGKPSFDFIIPEERARARVGMAEALQKGFVENREYQILTANGLSVPVEMSVSVMNDGNGKPIGFVCVTRNIAERKRVEEALRESEEKYRDLVENINDVIYAHDEKGMLTYVSPVLETLSGYSPSDLIGHSFAEFVYPEDLPALLESFQRTLAGQLEPSEFRALTKSGEIRWVRSSGRPLIKENRVVGLQGVLTDITAQKRIEKKMTALLDVAKDVSGILDLQELLDRVQRRTAEVLLCDIVATFYWDPERQVFHLISQVGLPPSLLADATALAFPPGQQFDGRLASGQPLVINDISAQSWLSPRLLAHFCVTALVAVSLSVRGRELGALVACSTKAGCCFTPDQIELLQGIARQLAIGVEATELYKQQQEEAEVAAALARVGQALTASLNAQVILDQLCALATESLEGNCGCTVLWQPAQEAYMPVALWGHNEEVRETLQVLRIPPASIVNLINLFKEKEVVEIRQPGTSGVFPDALFQQFAVDAALILRLQRGSELIGFQICGYRKQREFDSRHVRIGRGIAQIASLALANARLLEELERANRLKQDFVGTMSHELRTPLNIILGYSELLHAGDFGELTTEQSQALERIDKSAALLLDLVNETLALSRLQDQRVPLALAEVQISDLFAELEAEMRQLPRKPGVRLEWLMAPGLPTLWTDLLKLKIVLKNLIANALKFTDEGFVMTTARSLHGGVEFVVSDTGIGIAQEEQNFIFEPFRQVDGSTTRRHGGVGLGLYIVRQLLEILSGTVSVESELGKGSTFRVWLPHEGPNMRQQPTA